MLRSPVLLAAALLTGATLMAPLLAAPPTIEPLLAPPAQGAEPTVLVELYTSQGCSSCPPADKILGELAARGDVAAITFNVDYWDYLGWRDRLGKPEHTRRQRAYQAAFGERTVYTPQMVVQGREHVVGSRPRSVTTALAEHAGGLDAVVEITPDGEELRIAVSGGGATEPATVWLFAYDDRIAQSIGAGENGGREVVYHNVARSMERLGEWSGRAPAEFRISIDPDRDGVIVAVQRDETAGVGAVIGLAQLRLAD